MTKLFFSPKRDIKIYELAVLWATINPGDLCLARSGIDAPDVEWGKMPKEVRRHFSEVPMRSDQEIPWKEFFPLLRSPDYSKEKVDEPVKIDEPHD
jgi:hypothetical protein